MGSGGFKKYAPSDIENLMFFWVNFKYFLLYKHALVRMCFWNKFGCPTAAWGSAPHPPYPPGWDFSKPGRDEIHGTFFWGPPP